VATVKRNDNAVALLLSARFTPRTRAAKQEKSTMIPAFSRLFGFGHASHSTDAPRGPSTFSGSFAHLIGTIRRRRLPKQTTSDNSIRVVVANPFLALCGARIPIFQLVTERTHETRWHLWRGSVHDPRGGVRTKRSP
jgi:hypothetical protein